VFEPVQFRPEVESRVRWVEETDPVEIVEQTYRELANGTELHGFEHGGSPGGSPLIVTPLQVVPRFRSTWSTLAKRCPERSTTACACSRGMYPISAS